MTNTPLPSCREPAQSGLHIDEGASSSPIKENALHTRTLGLTALQLAGGGDLAQTEAAVPYGSSRDDRYAFGALSELGLS
jgi:hypothetical protein